MRQIIEDPDELTKDQMISELSRKSDRYGNLLIQMMNECDNALCIRDLSYDQVHWFYSKYKLQIAS